MGGAGWAGWMDEVEGLHGGAEGYGGEGWMQGRGRGWKLVSPTGEELPASPIQVPRPPKGSKN